MLKYPKRFTKEEKSRILSEHLKEGLSISELSRKHQVSAHSIYNWRNAMKKGEEKEIFLDVRELLEEIEQLKRENSRLKHAVAEQALDLSTMKQWNDFIKKKASGRKAEFTREFLRSSIIQVTKWRLCELVGLHPKTLHKKRRRRKKVMLANKTRVVNIFCHGAFKCLYVLF